MAVPKQFRNRGYRDVHVTSEYGTLIRRVTICNMATATKNGIKFHKNWRRAAWAKRIKPGDYVLTDDGWVIKVLRITKYVLHLETGSFFIRYQESYVTSRPNYNEHKEFILPSATHQKYRLIVREMITNGFDIKAALKGIGLSGNHRTMLNNDNFRMIFNMEVQAYFTEAGVKPSDVIRIIVDRMKDKDEPLRDIVKAGDLLLSLHPDFQQKSFGGNQLWLGDSEIMVAEEVQVEALPTPPPRIGNKDVLDPKKRTNLDEVIDDIESQDIADSD